MDKYIYIVSGIIIILYFLCRSIPYFYLYASKKHLDTISKKVSEYTFLKQDQHVVAAILRPIQQQADQILGTTIPNELAKTRDSILQELTNCEKDLRETEDGISFLPHWVWQQKHTEKLQGYRGRITKLIQELN